MTVKLIQPDAYQVTYKTTTVGAALDAALETKDLSNYGYVYGSGLDAKDAVLASIADTGSVYISGDVTLSRFPWPNGARIHGRGSVTSLYRPDIPAKVESVALYTSLMKGAYVWGVYSICDMLQLKTAGCNTLMHYRYGLNQGGTIEDAVNAAEAVGINLIINSQDNTPPTDIVALGTRSNVLGFYLFDEPQHNGVSVSQQDARIAAWRAVTDKSLCTSDNGVFGWDNPSISPNYDIIFPNLYYIAAYTDSLNKRFAVLSVAELQYKAPSTKLIPAVGLFSADASTNLPKNISFANDVFRIGGGDYLAFGWDSTVVEPTQVDIVSNTELYNRFVALNGISYNKPYTFDTLVFGRTLKLAQLVQALEPAYTSSDVLPFSVVASGSAIDERHQLFGDSGLAFRNTGGTLALGVSSRGYIASAYHYRDYAFADTSTFSVFSTPDDFFTRVPLESVVLANNTGFNSGYQVAKGDMYGIDISTSTSSPYLFKFLAGGLVNTDWVNSTY